MYFQRWADQRVLDPFFEAGRRMGFDRFELSHILAPETVAAVDPGTVLIAAVHHPCPFVSGIQASLMSADADARRRAEKDLMRTIATASRLGAPAVVVHLGHIEGQAFGQGHRLRFELESRYRAGHRGTARYADVLADAIAYRRSTEPLHLDRALGGLRRVLAHAAKNGVRVGLETGYGADELPTPDGMRRLLDELEDDGLWAWLDTGHVGAQENLGLPGFDAWLGSVKERWLGVHCHDVVGLRDHLVPGMGKLDFADLAGRLPSDAVVTCEFDWYFRPEEVSDGAERLRQAFG
jgi:sugar phosphate isomerase/epimerase